MWTDLRRISIAVIVAAAASSPAAAFTLVFQGTDLPGSQGNIFAYLEESPPLVSFAGQPFQISMDIENSPEGLYVQDFSESWSTSTYSLPYLTGASGEGFPSDPMYDFAIGFESSVSLSDTGGAVTIYPTLGWEAATDGAFSFTFDYTLSSPHPVGSAFTDEAVTGGGSTSFYVEDDYDPDIGPYDADSSVTFDLSRVTEVPEPAAWALLLVGVGAMGGALRRRRLGERPERLARGPRPIQESNGSSSGSPFFVAR